ncbi:MAG: hypothetical protein PCFJNLEI_03728 [Verrucomicrobiae bacterium]|nr:hypothetical protein [Verrucomicrobiae bacterium]
MPDEEFICPNCGAEVPAKAKACPECGADEKTGWADDTIHEEDPGDFDYDDWKRQEGIGKPSGRQVWIWIVAAVMLALFIYLLLR